MLEPTTSIERAGAEAATSRAIRPSNGSSHRSSSPSTVARATWSASVQARSHPRCGRVGRSACTSATLEPSYVLKALGVGDELAHTSIRFGLGRFNTAEEVDYVIERVVHEVRRLRDLSPLYEMAKEGIDLKSVEWQRE